MTALVLVNTVTIVQNSQPSKVFAGESISDAGIQASVLAAGGVLAPATDANVADAAALVIKMRSHGANESECNAVMMAAYTSSAYVSHSVPVANVAALQATVQAARADGQTYVTLDTYTSWVWEAASTASTSGTVIEPTDTAAGSGIGRFVAQSTTPYSNATDGAAGLMSAADKTKLDAGAVVQTMTLALTAAAVAALGAGNGPSPISAVATGATAFPANARFLGAETNITAAAAGGAGTVVLEVGFTSHLAAWVGNTTDLMTVAKTSVAGTGPDNVPGASIGGLTPICTVTTTTAALSTVTTLAGTVKLFYFVLP